MPDVSVEQVAEHLKALGNEEAINSFLRKVRARTAATVTEEAFAPEVASLRDYLSTPIPIPPSLVWPTIAVRGEITTTLGRAGKGKTTMNLNRIFAWAAGRALFEGWCDADGNEYLCPEKPLRTLIAENEGNAGMFHQKMGLLLHQGDLTHEQQEMCKDNIWVHGDGGYSGLKLDNDEGVKKLRAAIEVAKPDIVFIEPFRSLWRGEENSATDMAVVVDNMVSMATDYGCAIILSHHERKSGPADDGEKMSAGRGSTVLEGVVAVMENFESVKDGEFRELTWSKARYLVPPPTVRMEYDRESGWYKWLPTESIDDAILQAIREADDEPLTISDLMEATSEKRAIIAKRVESLTKDSRLKRMASVSGERGGSTGYRYRLPSGDNEEGGLSI